MRSRTTTRYSHLARVLHWLSALVIQWATVSGVYTAFWAEPEVAQWISSINVSLTTLFIPVFALRVVNRLVSTQPGPLPVSRSERRAAYAGHFILYALTAAVLASGVLMMDRDIEIFSWAKIRRLIGDETLNDLFGQIHRVAACLLALMIVIHIAAVIRHEHRGTPILHRMLWRIAPRRPADQENDKAGGGPVSAYDASGKALFCDGNIGAAHVRAHQLFDQGSMTEGHRFLGQWLHGRSGSGSDWVHIQFHMALFELGLGDWEAAYQRFVDQILPAAVNTNDALTDAPALLWRLQLAAPAGVDLPWQPLRCTALKHLEQQCDPFIELHHLLALAGAGDTESIERWVSARPPCDDPSNDCLLRRAAVALSACARRMYRQAAEAFENLLPQLPRIGGSSQQHSLFEDLARWSGR